NRQRSLQPIIDDQRHLISPTEGKQGFAHLNEGLFIHILVAQLEERDTALESSLHDFDKRATGAVRPADDELERNIKAQRGQAIRACSYNGSGSSHTRPSRRAPRTLPAHTAP